MPTVLDKDNDKIEELYREHGTVEAVADLLGVPRGVVSEVVDEMPLRQIYRRKGSPPTSYDRLSLIEILKKAAVVCGEPLTLPAYHKVAPKYKWPAALTITRAFGTWEAACNAAGVKVNPATGPRKGSYSVQDCLVALRVCRAALIEAREISESGAPSYERYVKWARANQQPSGPTVRAKVGPWRDALSLAYAE